jgi:hypothetical protein
VGEIDPEQERLAAKYAAMSDLELEKVGRDPDALAEWLCLLVRFEKARRDKKIARQGQMGGEPR